MDNLDYAEQIFKAILETYAEAVRSASDTIRFPDFEIWRRVTADNVHVAIKECIHPEVHLRHGTQTILAELMDFNPEVTPVEDAIAEVKRRIDEGLDVGP